MEMSKEMIEIVFSKNISSVKAKIKKDIIDIDSIDRDGRSFVYYAVLYDDIDFLIWLIENGADINLPDKAGWTALHFAANQNNTKMAKQLIESGAEINKQDSYGNTPLARAVYCSKGYGDLINLLLSYKADPFIKNNYGISALDLARTIANYDVKQFFVGY